MKKIIALLLVLLCISSLMIGCTQADIVNSNITMQASNFECERRITVYNARTDKIILEAEGLMNISNNGSHELVVTVKTGEDTYKKHYIYLNDYTLYVVEDITGARTNPYEYKIYFNVVSPDVEINP